MATKFDMTRYRGRQLNSRVALGLACAATSIGLFFLGTILLTLLWNGLSALHPSILTQMTPAPGSKGGLLNAIAGTVAMTTVGVALGGVAKQEGLQLASPADQFLFGLLIVAVEADRLAQGCVQFRDCRHLGFLSFSVAPQATTASCRAVGLHSGLLVKSAGGGGPHR